jgi:FAD/FMN-containing dehydrogenase
MIHHYAHAPWLLHSGGTRTASVSSMLDRRAFMRSGLATTALAVAPLGRAWSDTVTPADIPAEVAAFTLDGKPLVLKGADIRALRAALKGPLLLAQDKDYDAVRRIWDPAFNHHPALIARCANAEDVARAVDFARSLGIRTGVRSGGHSHSGQSQPEGGLMIDMTLINDVRVDVQKREVHAGGGTLLGAVDRATQAVGLATTLGTATDTGIAGLTLGGGLGRLMRRFGMAIDNLLSVDIVTADGRLQHASEQENPDLFWAVRGGGGNFGIATAFRYRLHPFTSQVIDGNRVYPYAQARAIFDTVIELAEHAPDELMVGATVSNTPPGGPNPAGRTTVVSVTYVGDDPGAADKLLAPLAKFGKPLVDTATVKSYLQAQGAEGAANVLVPSEVKNWIESGWAREVPSKLVDEMLRRFDGAPPSIGFSVGFGQMGGAVSRISPEATAFWHRSARYDLVVAATWTDKAQDALSRDTTRGVWAAVEPYSAGYYVNLLEQEQVGEKRSWDNYGGNFPRLVALKRKYDPGNLFRLNTNIKPNAV